MVILNTNNKIFSYNNFILIYLHKSLEIAYHFVDINTFSAATIDHNILY